MLIISYLYLLWTHLSGSSALLSSLSDEFNDNSSLGNWSNLRGLDYFSTYEINNDKLHMIPERGDWHLSSTSNYVYKNITGDFVVTCKLRSTGLNTSLPPPQDYSMSGLMIRTPHGGIPMSESWNWFTVGTIRRQNPPSKKFQLHYETTINNILQNETFVWEANENPDYYLQFARIGSTLLTLFRQPSDSFRVLYRSKLDGIHAPNYPSIVEIGIAMGTTKNFGLEVNVDWIRFCKPDEKFKNISSDFLMDKIKVNDGILISLLGDHAMYCGMSDRPTTAPEKCKVIGDFFCYAEFQKCLDSATWHCDCYLIHYQCRYKIGCLTDEWEKECMEISNFCDDSCKGKRISPFSPFNSFQGKSSINSVKSSSGFQFCVLLIITIFQLFK